MKHLSLELAMTYKIAIRKPNKIHEIEVWRQSDKTFKVILSWGSGYILVEEEPEIPASYSAMEGIDVNIAFDPIDGSFQNAYARYTFSENISKDEQELILKIYEDSMYEGLEALGWEHMESECWFYGNLDITELE